MNHNIHTLTFSHFKDYTAAKNEFAIIDYPAFIGRLDSDLHYKNKFYAVLLIKDAAGSIMIDDRKYELQPGKFFFINYHQVYFLTDCHSVSGKVLLFSKSFYNHVYTGNKMIKSDTALQNVSPFILLTDENTADIEITFNELNKESVNSQAFRKEVICLLLKVFMLKYIRNSSNKNLVSRSVDHKKELAYRFQDLVNQHYKELKSTADYAEKLSLTPNYLNALVKGSIGIPAGQVIKNRVILEAERLLIHSTLTVIQISYELGFSDNSHFGKYFRSVKGMSPNSYRLLNTVNQ